MNWRWMVLLWLLLEDSSSSPSLQRIKRVINGEVFNGRPLVYKAIRYYGFLGSVHGVPWYTLGYWDFLKNTGVYGNLKCSGSLLSTRIYQTACHCVASFYDNSANGEYISPAFVDHQWESGLVVYVGVSNRFGEESAVTYSPIRTIKFLVHSKCARMEGRSNGITHDFAIIQIDNRYMKADRHTPYPWTEFERAPQYTTEELVVFHRFALEKELVCLQIGFGVYIRDTEYPSDVLRHGWSVLRDHLDCLYWTSAYAHIPMEKVHEMMTWECADRFPHHEQEIGPGDSGGPVTCDNNYFGLVSQYHRGIRSIHSALVYDLYASSINYRSALTHELYELTQSYKDVEKYY